MNDIAARILDAIDEHPGASSNDVIRIVGVRKADGLDELQRLHQEGLLTFEEGKRGSRSWRVAAASGNRFPEPSRPTTSPCRDTASESES
jgi:hypothetical protein